MALATKRWTNGRFDEEEKLEHPRRLGDPAETLDVRWKFSSYDDTHITVGDGTWTRRGTKVEWSEDQITATTSGYIIAHLRVNADGNDPALIPRDGSFPEDEKFITKESSIPTDTFRNIYRVLGSVTCVGGVITEFQQWVFSDIDDTVLVPDTNLEPTDPEVVYQSIEEYQGSDKYKHQLQLKDFNDPTEISHGDMKLMDSIIIRHLDEDTEGAATIKKVAYVLPDEFVQWLDISLERLSCEETANCDFVGKIYTYIDELSHAHTDLSWLSSGSETKKDEAKDNYDHDHRYWQLGGLWNESCWGQSIGRGGSIGPSGYNSQAISLQNSFLTIDHYHKTVDWLSMMLYPSVAFGDAGWVLNWNLRQLDGADWSVLNGTIFKVLDTTGMTLNGHGALEVTGGGVFGGGLEVEAGEHGLAAAFTDGTRGVYICDGYDSISVQVGNISLGGQGRVKHMLDPVNNQDAATAKWVTDNVAATKKWVTDNFVAQ